MAGLVIAGPWLTMLGSRLMARRADRPAALIAGRRLADNPQAGFRAISGLVLALFVGSVAVGDDHHDRRLQRRRPAAPGASERHCSQDLTELVDPAAVVARPRPAGWVLDQLRAIPGVRPATTVHRDSFATGCWSRSGSWPAPTWPRVPALGRCPPGATVAQLSSRTAPASRYGPVGVAGQRPAHAHVAALPLRDVAVGTDGSAGGDRAGSHRAGDCPAAGRLGLRAARRSRSRTRSAATAEAQRPVPAAGRRR